jgi:ABC-type glutathione transport system ATPase component
MATHDIEMARELCPQAIVMCDGRVVAEGPTRDILLDATLLESAGL